MDSKILFQCLAIIAGTAAIISAAIPSSNKAVLVTTFALVAGVFQVSIFFLNTVEPPTIDYSIKLLDSNYSSEVEVDGYKWNKSFKRYTFELRSKAETSDANNVRLSFVFPTGIVGYRLLSKAGCDNISFSEKQASLHSISKDGSMLDTLPFYQNLLYIDIPKLLPDAKLTLNLILTYPLAEYGVEGKSYGIFDIEYQHKNSSGKESKEEFRHPILFKNKDSKELEIDRSKSVGPEHSFFHIMMPKSAIKIPFEKGSGIKLHLLPSRLKDKSKEENDGIKE